MTLFVIFTGTKPVESLADDDEIRYFLAVGMIENFNKDLRNLKELNQRTSIQSAKSLECEKGEIKRLASIIEGLEKEIQDAAEVEEEDQPRKMNEVKRQELTENNRMNKMILRDFKKDLRDFLNDTESLTPDYNETQGATIGHLLQALWKNYTDHGIHDYVSIESLDFDVDEDVLQHVKRAGLVVQNKNNPDQIRLVDFTLQ